MDIGAFKTDLEKAARKLKPESLQAVLKIASTLVGERAAIEAGKEIMYPHFQALTLEFAMGAVDKDELMGAIIEVLSRAAAGATLRAV